MKFNILQIAAKQLRPVMLIFSVFILLRGHHFPGGGFIAGLMAGMGTVLYAIAGDIQGLYGRLKLNPVMLIATGLTMCLFSTIAGPLVGHPPLTGQWINLQLPFQLDLSIGTPLLFDVGIYMLVTGMILMIMLTIMEELEWK
jgi:multicomponent Na+:H+ antiporter subunit B